MFEYLAMAYKDSDYTIVITVMHWLKRIFLVCWNSPWCWSYKCFCLPVGYHCSSARFDFHRQYSSQERPMKILTTPPWMPSCT